MSNILLNIFSLSHHVFADFIRVSLILINFIKLALFQIMKSVISLYDSR